MSSHTFHPPAHKTGLADDCPRCAEHARRPWATLDDETFTALWQRMIDVEYRRTAERYRSVTEAEAASKLYDASIVMQRLDQAITEACRELSIGVPEFHPPRFDEPAS